MLTNLSSLEAALVGLVVAALVIVRQFGTRPVLSAWMLLVPLGMAYVGATGIGALDASGLMLLAVNTALGIGLGVMRGTTFRLWIGERGQALMQGTRLTVALWLVTIAVRVVASIVEQRTGLSAFASGGTELLIPVAATLAAQNLVVYLRSRDQQLAIV